MNDVTRGFRDRRFLPLSERDKQDILKLMARLAEQAYRRGAQQGAGLTQRPCFRADLANWRYKPSLDVSPWVDRPRLTTSLERLDGECGHELRRIGFPLEDTSSRSSRAQAWPIAWRRSVWTGYTREQRCSIAAKHGRVSDVLEVVSSRPPPALEHILVETRALRFALSSEMQTGALLRMLAASKPGGRILEIGTGTGVGTAWLLDGMDASSRIISVDIDPQLQAVAREFLRADPRLELICADAAIFVARQLLASFDLIFADAIPGKYEHLDETLALLRGGGLYVVDDMLPQPTWPEDHAPRVTGLLSQLAKRPDLIGVGLAWASGVLVLTRR